MRRGAVGRVADETPREWAMRMRTERIPNCVNGSTHRDLIPVESCVTGEVLAHLCPACGAQLP